MSVDTRSMKVVLVSANGARFSRVYRTTDEQYAVQLAVQAMYDTQGVNAVAELTQFLTTPFGQEEVAS